MQICKLDLKRNPSYDDYAKKAVQRMLYYRASLKTTREAITTRRSCICIALV